MIKNQLKRLKRHVKLSLKSLSFALRARKLRKHAYFFGQDVSLPQKYRITKPSTTIIGNNVFIGENAYFKTNGWLRIGNNVVISRNVTIYTASHDYQGDRVPYDDRYVFRPVTIEDNVWVGMNVSILPGINIGEGAIIGLGAVVVKDVPKYAIVGGNPARVLKLRDDAHYRKMMDTNSIGDKWGRAVPESHLARYKPAPPIPTTE